MKWLLVAGVALAAVAVETNFVAPADAAEDVSRPAPRRAAPVARPAPRAAPAQAPASNWTGGQAGGQGGGSSGAQSFVDPGANQFFRRCSPLDPGCFPLVSPTSESETPFTFSGKPTSFTGGGFLGYRVQIGYLVVGVEGDASWKKLETSYTLVVPPAFATYAVGPPVTATRNEVFTGSITQDWDASFRGRIGTLVTPYTLLYATGGLAVGKISGSFSYSATTTYVGFFPNSLTDTTNGAASWSDTRLGGTVGGGLEYALGPFLKARLEYRYTDFGKLGKDVPLSRAVASCSGAGCIFGTPNIGSTNAHIDMRAAFHKVTLGVGFDF
jgi:outer membrane immunogenic protein